MRPVRSRSQGISLKSVVLLGCVLVPTPAVGAIGTLWGFGEIDLPFLTRGEQIPPGSVAVVVSRRAGRAPDSRLHQTYAQSCLGHQEKSAHIAST